MKDAYILVTRDCNNDCLFCSVPKNKESMTLEEIRSLVDRYLVEGFNQITISGGEPLLHPNILEILKYIRSKNMSSRLITNGTKLTKRYFTELVKSGLGALTISVHTLDAEKAKEISENQDYDLSYVLKMVDHVLNKKGFELNWNITVSGMNYKDLPVLAEEISTRFGKTNCVTLNFVDISGNAADPENQRNLKLSLDVAELYLYKALRIFKKHGVVVRVERVPLCYLVGFEDFSSDLNRISENESLVTVFTDKSVRTGFGDLYKKCKDCDHCSYSRLCYGVHPRYAELIGFAALYPIFHKFPENKLEMLKKR